MVIMSREVSDYEGFKSLTSYDELFTSKPNWVDENEQGTYINKCEDSYKIYHCIKDTKGVFVWHKLHSITISVNNHLLMDVSTMMALIAIENDLKDQLLISAVNKVKSIN